MFRILGRVWVNHSSALRIFEVDTLLVKYYSEKNPLERALIVSNYKKVCNPCALVLVCTLNWVDGRALSSWSCSIYLSLAVYICSNFSSPRFMFLCGVLNDNRLDVFWLHRSDKPCMNSMLCYILNTELLCSFLPVPLPLNHVKTGVLLGHKKILLMFMCIHSYWSYFRATKRELAFI